MIIGVVTIEQGKVNLTGAGIQKFNGATVVVEEGTEAIKVLDYQEFPYGERQEIGEDCLVTIPQWICNELGDTKQLLVIINDERKILLSPKTGDLL